MCTGCRLKSLVLDITSEMLMRPINRGVIHVGSLKLRKEVRAGDTNFQGNQQIDGI